MPSASNMIVLLGLLTLASAKPIMVTFGTHQGPIEPPEPTPKPSPRSFEPRNPAPVSEETEDIPNPESYRPPVPHQYRTKIFAQAPPSILGTPIDQKYTPAIEKFEIYKKQGRALGLGYTGPHFFERQEYEVIEEKRVKPVRYYVKPHYYQHNKMQGQEKTVPQIGVVYSAGVKYYVPQFAYVEQKQGEELENSVYDRDDEKHFYKTKGQ